MNTAGKTIGSIGLALLFAACSSDGGTDGTGGGSSAGAAGGTGGTSAMGGGSGTGTGGSMGGSSGSATTGGTGGTTGGAGGTTGGVSGSSGAGATGGSVSGSAGMPAAGGVGGGSGGMPTTGGAGGMGGSDAGGMSGTSGMAGSAGMTTTVDLPPLVTSASGAYWKTDGMLTESTASATVTVNDTQAAQKWDGFGGAFNELGWKFIKALPADQQTLAMKLLFSAAEGANFAWGRIPIGASDYAESRYTLTDTTDPTPSSESARPAQGTFSTTRDEGSLMLYVAAAQAVKPELRFWASPWTPPLWMKTGWKTNSGSDSSMNAKKPSFYDGGSMKSDASVLTAYADYFTKFVQAYKAKSINIELVSAQNEPGFDQNYPSCLWDGTTYTTFVANYLGPAMQTLGVKVMLGTMSNDPEDTSIATTVLANSTAKGFLLVAGVQWEVLDKVTSGTTFGGLPIWATEHKCGNYPWESSYNNSQAPNDQAYGEESWGYIKKAIVSGKVTSYSAWNMVLDKSGLGIDTTRDWKQDALLVADGGKINPTPAYYVFRHMSQYVTPGATVVGTSGGDAVAWKNPDGSLVVTMFNSGAANSAYVVAIGGKKYSFNMPSKGWATVKYKP